MIDIDVSRRRVPGPSPRVIAGAILIVGLGAAPRWAHAEPLIVTATLHRAISLTNDDGWEDDDIYWKVRYSPVDEDGDTQSCSTLGVHSNDDPDISPDWQCASIWDVPQNASAATLVQIDIELWEQDSGFNGADDLFDIHPASNRTSIRVLLDPMTQQVRIPGVLGFETPRCPFFPMTLSGAHGDDRATVVFSVTSSRATNGDSDGDGLQDVWEVCGMDGDADGIADVDLPAFGADPFRKDVFVELDWFVDDDGIGPGGAGTTTLADHSHEPWLPALVEAWEEFDSGGVTNGPRLDGTPVPNGVALHVDVGTLYANYQPDFDGDGIPEFVIGPSGNVDLDGDGRVDIGDFGGGNRICEDLSAPPCAPGEWRTVSVADATTIGVGNFDARRSKVFWYGLFMHERGLCDSTSGVAPHGAADFAVSLASRHAGCSSGWGREAPPLVGPSGLPVDGTIGQHTGTFLHELGHAMSLGHGGTDGLNRKPNYLSVMSYSFQIPGIQFDYLNHDLMAEPLGIDRNRDGMPDPARYSYSAAKLPPLDESSLDEPAGIGDGTALISYGPTPCDVDGDGTCDFACAQTARTARGDQPIDWNRDGDPLDLGVFDLAAPPASPGDLTDINRNCTIEVLPGADDWHHLRDRDMGRPSPVPGAMVFGLTKEAFDEHQSRTRRVRSLPDQAFIAARCDSVVRRHFDELAEGPFDPATYAPKVAFVPPPSAPPAVAEPRVLGPSGRGGFATLSEPHSLSNGPASAGLPMIIELDPPQRMVGMYHGSTQRLRRPMDVTLSAFDVEGRPMGSTTAVVSPVPGGITEFIGLGSIFNKDEIARLELSNDGGVPVQIDDLVTCREMSTLAVPPTIPPPVYGDLDVELTVASALFLEIADPPPEDDTADDGPHGGASILPFEGASLFLDGEPIVTGFTQTLAEGTQVALFAPKSVVVDGTQLAFVRWMTDGRTQFPDGDQSIEIPVGRPLVATAIYTTGTPVSCSAARRGGGAGTMILLVCVGWFARRRRADRPSDPGSVPPAKGFPQR